MTEQNQPKTGPIQRPANWQPAPQAAAANPLAGQPQVHRPETDPARERIDREESVQTERRRRKGGTLNRMAQFKLDIIPEEYLDKDRYVYRWVNDEGSKLLMATRHDDYDYVKVSELNGFDPEGFDSEGGETVRMLVGESRYGGPLYAYLLKKRKEFWEADNDEVVRAREDMMAGRVYRAEIGDEEELKDKDYDRSNYYASGDNQLGGSAQRKKGPVPKRIIR